MRRLMAVQAVHVGNRDSVGHSCKNLTIINEPVVE